MPVDPPPQRATSEIPTQVAARDFTLDTLPAGPVGKPVELPSAGYQLGEVIGRGGMGEVIAAHDARIGRDVAIKRMRAGEPNDEAVTRFLREARIQARLDHPAIVPVFELGTDETGRPYFTMKRLAGKTLERALAEAAPLRGLLRAFIDVCLAIDLAHARGVIHRDLKPANIMLGDYGEVYVLDWGIARVLGERQPSIAADELPPYDTATATGAMLGTPGYMSPEQIADPREVLPATDSYALGAILFEILVGESLHPRGTDALASTLTKPQESPTARRPEREIPPELDRTCTEALALDPQARPTARELGDRVQRYLDGDRDLAERRRLAAEHLAVARAALATGAPEDRALAMRRAGSAFVLDPGLGEAVELVSAMMFEPPAQLPADLHASLELEHKKATIDRSKRAALSYALVFAMWGVIPFLDVRSWSLVLGFYAMIAIGATFTFFRSKTGNESAFAALVINCLLALWFSRIAGPFMLTSIFTCTVVVALAQSAWAQRRPMVLFVWVVVTVMGPLVLEWLGVIGTTWGIRDGSIHTESVMYGLHGVPEEAALVIANLLFMLILTMFAVNVGRGRSQALRKVQIQAWHLRQLLPPPQRT